MHRAWRGKRGEKWGEKGGRKGVRKHTRKTLILVPLWFRYSLVAFQKLAKSRQKLANTLVSCSRLRVWTPKVYQKQVFFFLGLNEEAVASLDVTVIQWKSMSAKPYVREKLGSDLSTRVLPTFCLLTIGAISLESRGKPFILQADDFLGACCGEAMTQKLWTLLFFSLWSSKVDQALLKSIGTV